MKIDRLMGITAILTQRGSATAPQLAQRFEVSRRTITRDVEALCKAGIPIVTTQGRGGGISIAPGYRVDHSLLTRDELAALLTGLKGLDSVSLASYQALAAKLAGQEEPLPEDVFLIDLSSHYHDPLSQKISLLKKAILKRQIVSFQYYSEKEISQRQAEPYLLIFRWSSWYLWGWCLTRQDFRLFKLNRLWQLEITAREFPPRKLPQGSPDLDRYLREGSLRLKALFSPSEKYRLVEEYGPESFQETPEGLLLERTFAGKKRMLEWVMSFGGAIEVLEPQNLRDQICQEAKKVLSNHDKHDILMSGSSCYHNLISEREDTAMIESRCGLLCSQCAYREQMNCPGCTHMDKPFWAESCPLKSCCEGKSQEHCGQCGDFSCDLLHQFAYDPKQGDEGKRLEQCKAWQKKD